MNLSPPISDPAVRLIAMPAGTVVTMDREKGTRIRESLVGEIAARCGLPPAEVAIVSSPGMKPRVEIGGRPDDKWHVSFGYTRQCAIGVLSAGRAVGVDIEWIDPEFRWRPVATELFPPGIIAGWEHLSPDGARREFFRHWVRWEAALKCRGTGFGTTHLALEVASAGLNLFDLHLEEGYAGCLALEPT